MADLLNHSLEIVAEKIKEYYGEAYDDIGVWTSNEKIDPENEEPVYFTADEKAKAFAENYRLIYHVSNFFRIRGGVEYEEITLAGLEGMIKALNTYDKNRGVAKFSTYAVTCIRNEISNFLRKEKGVREDDKNRMVLKLEDILATDETGRSFMRQDLILDESVSSFEEDVIVEEQTQALILLLDKILTRNEKYVILHRYRLVPGIQRRTQQEIADALDMTQPNVSKLELTAKEKLYTYFKKKGLAEGKKDVSIYDVGNMLTLKREENALSKTLNRFN